MSDRLAKGELALLSLANEKGKFAIAIGLPMDEPMQEAFERGIDMDWFTLVDVAPIAHSHLQICRVFKLTEAGKERRAYLRCTP